MPDEKSNDLAWAIQDFLEGLREARVLAPCDVCGFPVARAITYDGAWLCGQHMPEPEEQQEPLEIKDEEDG